ncbi:MAG: glycosyltransferase [Bacteroidia bacterium]|nr:glycosyltransferase [Bacteroidia bacterium]MCO5252834.1 glycosyltransferase [Bacteroidota bacterium]MCZ2128742.1 glycosyltransferase [Bacteroidia bacterium]
MPDNKDIIFSFIVPVYNTGVYLEECLDSIIAQDFDLNRIEIIVVDDCSTDKSTQEFVLKIKDSGTFKGFPITVIINEKNSWLAETRNVGVRNSKGEFIVCLDSDDIIEPDYLKYCYIAHQAYPKASWVYPSVRKFGYRNKVDIAPYFSSKNLFLQNYMVVTSPIKRELWNKLNGQRTKILFKNIKMLEDWDFWQRALKKKRFGVPIKKVLFNYRQNIHSLLTRTEEEGNLSILLAYRQNWMSIFFLRASQNAFKEDDLKYAGHQGILSKLFIKLISLTTGRKPGTFSIKDALRYVFAPSLLIKKRLESEQKLTKTHKMAGFKSGFPLEFDKDLPICNEYKKTALCTHFWWHVGGAENILADYTKEIKGLGYRVVDVAIDSEDEAKILKNNFSKIADEQIALDEIGNGPYPKLLALWEIIKIEKPRIILNMSNPFIYILSPLIKEKFPNTTIYDLLHCEEFNDNGWFEAAHHFQKNIDKRIVTSAFWKDVLIKKYKEESAKIEVIYNMINYDAFVKEPKSRDEKLKKYHIDPNKKIIGFLGRFHEQKRPDIFVELAYKMQNNNDFHFVMTGDGPMLEDLLPTMKSLPNLTYTGATKNPEKFFTMFDIAIFPSLFEGYPLVGIECAQIGLPIIAADIVGFNEIITNGKAGMLYEVKSEEEDVDSIRQILLNDYDTLLELGKNGPDFVNKFHNKEDIIKDIHRVFTLN